MLAPHPVGRDVRRAPGSGGSAPGRTAIAYGSDVSNSHAAIQAAVPISLAVVTLGYALMARRLQSWNITAPMVFVTAGVVLTSGLFGERDLIIKPTDG